ncbi:MAG: hypothetical protein ABIT38_13255 [Gemmatimonadaceae bacterium]
MLATACNRTPRALSPADLAAAERAAIVQLFLSYERPQQLVFWDGAPRDSPIFGEIALGDSLNPRGVSPESLLLPIPVSVVHREELERLFHENADAWEAWYRLHPASGGVVEVTAPRLAPPSSARITTSSSASVVIGRLCGEHCRSAWNVTVEKKHGEWIVKGVRPVALPKL